MSGVIHCLVHSISTGHPLLLYLLGQWRPLRILAGPSRRPLAGGNFAAPSHFGACAWLIMLRAISQPHQAARRAVVCPNFLDES